MTVATEPLEGFEARLLTELHAFAASLPPRAFQPRPRPGRFAAAALAAAAAIAVAVGLYVMERPSPAAAFTISRDRSGVVVVDIRRPLTASEQDALSSKLVRYEVDPNSVVFRCMSSRLPGPPPGQTRVQKPATPAEAQALIAKFHAAAAACGLSSQPTVPPPATPSATP